MATYTPAANYHGADSFTFTVADSAVTSAPATVTLDVTPVNDPPLAIAQLVTVAEDGTVEITLTGSDIDGDSLTILTGIASQGTVNLSGSIATYTPAANYHGADSFTFTVADSTVTSAPATVTLDVTPVNDPPLAIAQLVTVAEDGTVEITLTGSDIDGDSLTFLTDTAAHGTVTLAGAVATYIPAANYHGPDSFSFTVTDGTVTSPPATVSITVNEVPEDDFFDWLAEHSLVTADADSDNDTIGNAVEYVIGGNPASGADIDFLPTCSPVDAAPGGNPVETGYLRFTYRRTDRAESNPSAAINVEWCTDLAGTWTDAAETPNVVVEVTDDGFGAGVDRVDVYLPYSLAVGGKLFTRLGVTIAPP